MCQLWNEVEIRRYGTDVTDDEIAWILISFQFQFQLWERCVSQHSVDHAHDRLGVGSRLFQPQRVNVCDKCFVLETQRILVCCDTCAPDLRALLFASLTRTALWGYRS